MATRLPGAAAGFIYCYWSSPTVVNSILWGDTPQEISLTSASINITYSDIQGGWTGAGNINANPQFIGGGDYHLRPTSPCIDAGNNSAPNIPSRDKDGNPRIINARVDMGAYEYQFFISELSPSKGPVGTEVTIKGYGASQTVTISFGTHPTITSTRASTNGTFSTTFIVSTQTGGTKVITATSLSLFATTTFYILKTIGISLSTSTIGFGFCETDTLTGSQTIIVKNTGNVTEDFLIRLGTFTDGINTWAIGQETGIDKIIAEYYDGASWQKIQQYDVNQTLKTNVSFGTSFTTYFRIKTPKETSSGSQYKAELRITAMETP